jgi:hypothetical protein
MKIPYLVICLISATAATGCFKPVPPAAQNEPAKEAPQVNDATAAPPQEAAPRKTINEKTQNVLALEEAIAAGGQVASSEISATNPLLQQADAYRTSVAKLGALAVEQAIQIRNASSIKDPKPLTHAEFLREIIKPGQPDGIWLAMLPYYQEYAWDAATQKLVAVDFPRRIEEREKNR